MPDLDFTPNAFSLAAHVHRPLVDLCDVPSATLTARAPVVWLAGGKPFGWGPAMFLVSSTRRLLHQGGLLLPQQAADIQSANPAWARALEAASYGGAADAVFYVRALLYANFVADAVAYARIRREQVAHDSEAGVWLAYLESLARSLSSADARTAQTIETSVDIGLTSPGILRFSIAMLFAAANKRSDGVRCAAWLREAERCIETSKEIASDALGSRLARARLARHEAELNELRGDEARRVELVEGALELLRYDAGDDVATFLLREGTRRVLAYDALASLRVGAYARANRSAARIAILDPACPHGLTIAGEAAIAADALIDARGYFRRAARYGVLERPHALARLTALEAHDATSDAARRECIESARSFQPAPVPWSNEQQPDAPLPLSLAATDAMVTTRDLDDVEPLLTVSDGYRRMLPYWELRREKEVPAPRHTLTPLLAFRSFVEKTCPYWTAITTQRGMGNRFRTELASSALNGIALLSADPRVTRLTRLEGMRGRSAETETLFAAVDHADQLDALDRARLGRLLGALGFYTEGLAVTTLPPADRPWTAEEEYLASSHMFLTQLANTLSKDEYQRLHGRILERIRPTALNLRTRHVLVLNGLVYAAKRSAVEDVRRWTGCAHDLRRRVEACAEIPDFERTLLISRTYRATSFLPFFEEDRDRLVEEITLCERFAREATPTTDFEAELAIDNLYAALESIARTYRFLGDHDRVAACYEELTRIDPFDSHAWLQRGDNAQRCGDLESAIDAFAKAERFGPPQSAIAAFRAGRMFERANLPHEAIACHLRAVRQDPGGTSPYVRLALLARQVGDHHLGSWSIELLAALASADALSEAQRRQLDDLVIARAA